MEEVDLAVRTVCRGNDSDVGRQALGSPSLLAVVVIHEVDERSAQVVPETPGRRIGAAEIPAEEAEDKLLKQIQRRLLIAERALEITVHRPTVALD
jgi:hypothetical protein